MHCLLLLLSLKNFKLLFSFQMISGCGLFLMSKSSFHLLTGMITHDIFEQTFFNIHFVKTHYLVKNYILLKNNVKDITERKKKRLQ